MKATGVVRRIDDLGRVVIPKEIRRQMAIKKGDPLEIFTTTDGCVCFKKYRMYDKEYHKVFEALKPILSCGFSILNNYGEVEHHIVKNYKDMDNEIPIIDKEDDIVGYIAVNKRESSGLQIELDTALAVAKVILGED